MKETTTSRRKRFITGVAIGLTFLIAVSGVHADEKVTFFHVDVAGSPVAATDEAGDVVWREDYQPYGARINNESEAASNDRWFTGHPHDDDTGLTYTGARYYDPVVGRFMAVDPKEFSADNLHSFNRFAYGNNNPYKFVDPDGRDAVSLPLRFEAFDRTQWVSVARGLKLVDVEFKTGVKFIDSLFETVGILNGTPTLFAAKGVPISKYLGLEEAHRVTGFDAFEGDKLVDSNVFSDDALGNFREVVYNRNRVVRGESTFYLFPGLIVPELINSRWIEQGVSIDSRGRFRRE